MVEFQVSSELAGHLSITTSPLPEVKQRVDGGGPPPGFPDGGPSGAGVPALASAADGQRGAKEQVGDPAWAACGDGLAIRVPQPPGSLACPHCQTRFEASGPTGFEGGQPICDMCFLERDHQLGMLLVLATIVRLFGAHKPSSRQEYRDVLEELGAFARLYERLAARSGPPRILRLTKPPTSTAPEDE